MKNLKGGNSLRQMKERNKLLSVQAYKLLEESQTNGKED